MIEIACAKSVDCDYRQRGYIFRGYFVLVHSMLLINMQKFYLSAAIAAVLELVRNDFLARMISLHFKLSFEKNCA